MLAKLSRAITKIATGLKIAKLKEIIVATTAQPFGTAVAAKATELTAALNQLALDSTAKDLAAVEATRTVTVLATSNETVNTLVEQYYTGIESATNNDPALLALTTADLQTPAGKSPAIGQLAAPENLHFSTGDFPGTADGHSDNVHGASGFAWRHTIDPNNPALWVNAPSTTRSSTTIGGLLSGIKYYFQNAAIGAAGQSPWSDICQGMAA